MKHQMRMYTINRGMMDEFVRAWRAGVVPLRIKAGFQVSAAWINNETNQFIWILSYDGADDWEQANAAYYASPERASLNPDPVSMIARIETHFVEDVEV